MKIELAGGRNDGQVFSVPPGTPFFTVPLPPKDLSLLSGGLDSEGPRSLTYDDTGEIREDGTKVFRVRGDK